MPAYRIRSFPPGIPWGALEEERTVLFNLSPEEGREGGGSWHDLQELSRISKVFNHHTGGDDEPGE
jgi:hypothetical protein